MKKLLFIAVAALFLSSCVSKPQSSHEVRWSEDKHDSVVYVNHYDNNGNMSSFFVSYLVFHTLFNQGGYGTVHNYYSNHRTELAGNQSQWSSYKPRANTYSSPSSKSSSSYNSTRSYSSPSRSSSYSSPSRGSGSSYSSPSRSYSSPSYSSPSRSSSGGSYSSPSRR